MKVEVAVLSFLSLIVLKVSVDVKQPVQDGICARGKDHTCSIRPSEVSPESPLETVPVFVCLTMALSRPFKEDRLALPLSTTPLSSGRSMV